MPRPQWFSLRFAGKGAALALGSGAAVSLFIDNQWRTFERSKTDVTVNSYIPARGNGLAGYSFTAYNSPSAALKEAIVEYPSLGSPRRQDGSDTAVPLVDVCVVGGGFAGLHAALALAEKGAGDGFNKADRDSQEGKMNLHRSIAVLEANRVGSGASGACGGMAIVGYETELELLEWLVGPQTAKALFSQSIAGYERLKRVIRDYKIHCGMVEEGLLEMMLANRFISDKSALRHSIRGKREGVGNGAAAAVLDNAVVEEEMKSTSRACNEEEEHYGQICNVLSKETIEKTKGLSSDRFAYGCFNPRTFSVNPLALVFGLARACVGTGRVSIYERSRVVSIEREPLPANASTDGGNVRRLLEEQMRERGANGVDVAEFLSTTAFGNTLRGDEVLRERIRLAATYDKFGAGDFVVTTADGGVLKAKEVVLATNAVPWELRPSLAMLTAPCTTSIMLTRPFSSLRDGGAKASSAGGEGSSVLDAAKAELNKVFSFKGCVIDERFGLVYFRRVEGDRILFGGLASGKPFCARGTGPNGGGIDLKKDASRGRSRLGEDATMSVAATRLADEFSRTFPTLAPFLEVEECWEGRIEHRDTMFPLVGRDPRDGLWYSFGFSGHGVVPTCAAGDLLASAIHSVRHPSETLLLSEPRKTPPSSILTVSNPLFLEPTDRRYELWKEVSLFPSAAFKRAKKELESRQTSSGLEKGKQGHNEPTHFFSALYIYSSSRTIWA